MVKIHRGATIPIDMETTSWLVDELTAARACIRDLAEALELAILWIDPFDVADGVNDKLASTLTTHAEAIKAAKIG